MESVVVKSYARLHFGVIDMSARKRYGAIGLALNRPNFVVLARFSHGLELTGVPESLEYQGYVREVVRKICKHFGIKEKLHIEIQECFPLHVGLGGRTQCGLAVANAILSLFQLKEDVEEIREILGLGRYTRIGINAFYHGGFIIDTGGKKPIILEFPEDWAFLVGIPEGKGLSEEQEARFMQELVGSEDVSAKICEQVLLEIVPAIASKDIERFGRALSTIQKLTGSVFSPVQGGIFASYSEPLRKKIEDAGAYATGQSSWGPTVYGLFPTQEAAQKALEKVKAEAEARFFVAKARNRGALVE